MILLQFILNFFFFFEISLNFNINWKFIELWTHLILNCTDKFKLTKNFILKYCFGFKNVLISGIFNRTALCTYQFKAVMCYNFFKDCASLYILEIHYTNPIPNERKKKYKKKVYYTRWTQKYNNNNSNSNNNNNHHIRPPSKTTPTTTQLKYQANK